MEFDSRTVLSSHGVPVACLGSTTQRESAWSCPPQGNRDGSLWPHENEAHPQSPANVLSHEGFSHLDYGNNGLSSFRSSLSINDRRERNVAVYQSKRGLLRSSSAPKYGTMQTECASRPEEDMVTPAGFESIPYPEEHQSGTMTTSQMFLHGENMNDMHRSCSQAPCVHCNQQLHAASTSSRGGWCEREHCPIKASWSWSPLTDNKRIAHTPRQIFCSRQGSCEANTASCVEHEDCKLDCSDSRMSCNCGAYTFQDSMALDRDDSQSSQPYPPEAFWGADDTWQHKKIVQRKMGRQQILSPHSAVPVAQTQNAPPLASPLACRSDPWANEAMQTDIEKPYTSFSKPSFRKPPLHRTFGSAGQKHWGGRHAYNSDAALRETSNCSWQGAPAGDAMGEMRNLQLNNSRGMNVETGYEGNPPFSGEKRCARGVSCDDFGKGGGGGDRRTNEIKGTPSFSNRSTGAVSIADLDTLQEELETAPLKRLDRSKQIRKQWTLVQMEYDLNAQKFTMKNLDSLAATP